MAGMNSDHKTSTTAKKWGFPLSISSVNVTKSAGSCRLVTFTNEILNGKHHFLCSVLLAKYSWICLVLFAKRMWIYGWIHAHVPNKLPVVRFWLSLIILLINLCMIILSYICILLWRLICLVLLQHVCHFCCHFYLAFSKNLFCILFEFSFYNQNWL